MRVRSFISVSMVRRCGWWPLKAEEAAYLKEERVGIGSQFLDQSFLQTGQWLGVSLVLQRRIYLATESEQLGNLANGTSRKPG